MAQAEYHVTINRPLYEILSYLDTWEDLPAWQPGIFPDGGFRFEVTPGGTRVTIIGHEGDDSFRLVADSLVSRVSSLSAKLGHGDLQVAEP